MKRTKLRIASQIAGVAALALGATAVSASAEQRQLLVTLANGKKIPVTVDVAPGTPVGSIQLGDFGSPVVSVVEIPGTPTSTATTPAPTTSTPAPTPTTPTSTARALTTPTTVPTTPTTPTTTPTTPRRPKAKPRTHTTSTPATGGVVTPTKNKAKGKAKVEGSALAVDKTAGKKAGSGAGSVTDTIAPSRPATTTPTATTPANTTAANSGAQPSPSAPGFTDAPSLTPTTSVPNFFIDQFQIPPFLLPIYQAAGTQFGIPWQVLAAINEIETDYGRNLSVSSAGALGWMQFMPASWAQYGMDANNDGVKDPYNPVDAIFAAARYLRAAGGDRDISKAIFSYNHADWYVQSVLLRARVIGGMPANLVGSLTGLTEGLFPVAARATYADSISTKAATKKLAKGANAATTVEGNARRHSINVFAKSGAPVIAINDGRIVKVGQTPALGRYVVLQDVYGNRYSYDHLGSLATKYPVPKTTTNAQAAASTVALPSSDATPTKSATAGLQQGTKPATPAKGKAAKDAAKTKAKSARQAASATSAATAAVTKERLFANPARPAAYKAGGARQLTTLGQQISTFKGYFSQPLAANPKDYVLKPLKAGSTVIAGTILGRVGKTDARLAPHVEFTVRPAGRGAPLVDPKPILDGWKLLESTAIYRANGKGSLFSRSAQSASTGQVLLMSKDQLQQRVLGDPNLDIYQCGRQDIQRGIIDRRVLATLEFLSTSGLKLQISALECGHSYMTTSGNVSEHTTGDAVDISAVNGIPITGHQGPGSITDLTIRRLLTLQGTMKPHQIISLMTYPGTDNTLSLPDHFNHIHIGFHPLDATNVGAQVQAILKPAQWTQLINQISTIQNPTVPTSPSKYAIRDATKQAGNGG